MLISSGYGVFSNRRIKELKLDRWFCGKSSKLCHSSDSTDAEQQINWLVPLGEQANTLKLSGQYSFRINILATLGVSITLIKSLDSRTGD